MVLSSPFFTTDIADKAVRDRLKDCSEIPLRHIFQGQKDEPGLSGAVQRIQDALRQADFSINITDPDGVFGQSTADAVFKFKSRDPPILGPGQRVPDRIVGIKTIAALDAIMGGQPPKPVTSQFQDIVVRILGFDPNNAEAGKQTSAEQEQNGTDGQPAIQVPSVSELRTMINTEKYLKLHNPVVILNFNGGGGQANARSDPTTNILTALRQARSAAAASKSEPGKIILYGWSIGGRAAAVAARAIKADPAINQPLDYLGVIDAAWDSKDDVARKDAVNVLAGDNIFQSASNVLLDDPDSGITEFHGTLPGVNNFDLNRDGSWFSRQMIDFLKGTHIRKKRAAFEFFNITHKNAVIIGHRAVQTKVLNILGV